MSVLSCGRKMPTLTRSGLLVALHILSFASIAVACDSAQFSLLDAQPFCFAQIPFDGVLGPGSQLDLELARDGKC